MKSKVGARNIERAEDKDLDAAIELVYKKYGTDLRAFFRDVYAEMMQKREESQNSNQRTATPRFRGARS